MLLNILFHDAICAMALVTAIPVVDAKATAMAIFFMTRG